MAVRIYALAKELKFDSKELVEICTKAGITGKGSALASLADDEVVRLKEYLSGRHRGGERAIGGSSGGGTAIAEPEVVRREDYIAPAGVGGKPPVLDTKPERPAVEVKKKPAADAPKPPPKAGPAIRLASLPPTAHVPPPKSAAEPAPQKPDLKLPMDAIRAGRAGGAKPLADHLRKHEQKRAAQSGKPSGPGPAPRPSGVSPLAPAGEEGAGRERRRGVKPAAAKGKDEFDQSLGGREARQLARKRSGTAPRRAGEDDDSPTSSRRRALVRQKRPAARPVARKGKITFQLPATVRSFSEAAGVTASQVLQKLLALDAGMVMNINAALSPETVELLAVELGLEFEIKQPVNLETQLLGELDKQTDDPARLQPRPPVITFLGHVDHGKTSLLDKIIGIDVASGESGGITQHIRAYQIEKDGRKISFVDTPGHEAFTEMRARGANVTDIAVLVVAADDGVMPQTEEAISHARAAGVPIVVALNKIDLPGVDTQRIYQQLATAGLLPTEWGGDVEVVKTSATKGTGIDDLLETLFTIAELHDLKADPDHPAVGTCLEASVHEGRGVVAKLIVQSGTLRVGDAIFCGTATGHVKAMYDTLDLNSRLGAALPSTPLNMTGLDVAPRAGERFYVLQDISQARQIALKRQEQSRQVSLGGGPTHVTLETLFDRLGEVRAATLNIILRADTRGSIEAIQKELTKLEHPEVKIKVLQATVGGVSEADVHLADASDAVIIGFNVVPDEKARALAEQKKVQVRRYEIIYKVTEDLRAALEGMLKPEQREAELGRVIVQRTFTISRIGTIAGCQRSSGTGVPGQRRIRVISRTASLCDRRLRDRIAEARERRRARRARGPGVRHQAGRVQRRERRRRAGSVSDRGNREDAVAKMTNDEIRMTKECRSTNDENARRRKSRSLNRHSSFDIRH